jgi:hypothetical protein
MRKLWVKAWITLDGVFDSDTMDYWWQSTNSPERNRVGVVRMAIAAAWPSVSSPGGASGCTAAIAPVTAAGEILRPSTSPLGPGIAAGFGVWLTTNRKQ